MSTQALITTTTSKCNNAEVNGAVRFNDLASIPQKFHEREKYLTAKYPQEQMQLIRKRLKVEFWLDDQLRSLYDVKDNNDHEHCPEDLIDSLLDMDDELARQRFLQEKLIDVKQSPATLMDFIEELLNHIRLL